VAVRRGPLLKEKEQVMCEFRCPLAVLCVGVLAPLAWTGVARAEAPPQAPMAQYFIPDPHLNVLAWKFAAPADWEKSGSVGWTGYLKNAYFSLLSVRRPQSAQEFKLYPSFIFSETNDPRLCPESEVSRVLDPATCVSQVIIPRCRREACQGQVVRAEACPELAQEATARIRGQGYNQLRIQAARVLVEYVDQGRPVEEIFFCVTAVAPRQSMAQFGYVTIWCIDKAYSLRAEKGQLGAAWPTLSAIAGSLQENPRWVTMRKAVLDRLVAQVPLAQGLGPGYESPVLALSRHIAANADATRVGIRQSFEYRQAVPGTELHRVPPGW
jgi:hypothetical protein